jgi:hypothetical protein
MTAYCPRCWAEAPPDAHLCPACGADLEQEVGDYPAKLIAALHHPEPLTQRRAAYLLGLLGNPDGVEALAAGIPAVAPAPPCIPRAVSSVYRRSRGQRAPYCALCGM